MRNMSVMVCLVVLFLPSAVYGLRGNGEYRRILGEVNRICANGAPEDLGLFMAQENLTVGEELTDTGATVVHFVIGPMVIVEGENATYDYAEQASRANRLACLKYLRENRGYDPAASLSAGTSHPFYDALDVCDRDIIFWFLEQKLDVSGAGGLFGRTPVHSLLASIYRKRASNFDETILAGAEEALLALYERLTLDDEGRNRLLGQATYFCNLAFVQRLLEDGADPTWKVDTCCGFGGTSAKSLMASRLTAWFCFPFHEGGNQSQAEDIARLFANWEAPQTGLVVA